MDQLAFVRAAFDLRVRSLERSEKEGDSGQFRRGVGHRPFFSTRGYGIRNAGVSETNDRKEKGKSIKRPS